MIKKVLLGIIALVGLVFFGYLVLPNPAFPKPPPDSLQSQEPADTETPLRRAYFTNYTRQQVLDWYEAQWNDSGFLNLPLPTYLLNYPPEDAQTIIRDQTRSTFLQEVVHPFRESLYINGFEPDPKSKDAINIGGRDWRQKIIIHYVPSSTLIRLVVFAGTVVSVYFLFLMWKKVLNFRHE